MKKNIALILTMPASSISLKEYSGKNLSVFHISPPFFVDKNGDETAYPIIIYIKSNIALGYFGFLLNTHLI